MEQETEFECAQVSVDEFGHVTTVIPNRMALYTLYNAARRAGVPGEDILSLIDEVTKLYDHYHPQARIGEEA